MKVAVTGAGGFIGTHLVEKLTADGHQVRAIAHHEPVAPYRRPAWEQAAERVVADLTDIDAATEAIRGAEWVFHLAADVGGVGYLTDREYRAWLTNSRMSANVLTASADVERFYFQSSSCAYPTHLQQRSRTRVLREGDLERGAPDLMYGREKLATLRACEAAPFDARVGVVNTVFGPGLHLTGPQMKYPAALVTRAIAATAAGTPLDIWGDGRQVRGYLHVTDAVDKIVRIMTEPYDGPVNISSTETASCTQVAEMVLDILDHSEVPLRYIDGPTGPAVRMVSNDKWERTYGRPDPQMSMREAFEDFVAWVLTQ